MTAPCINCPDRQMHCHGKCERYAEFAAAREKEREERFRLYKDKRAASDVLIESALKRRRQNNDK